MVVKVQISQFDSHSRKMMLIYGEDRGISYEGEAIPEVLDLMGDSPKKFFHATLVPDPEYPKSKKKRKIQINESAPWQNW